MKIPKITKKNFKRAVYRNANVCVYLYSFTVKASSVCNDVWDIIDGTDQRSCVVSISLGAPAKFVYLLF